MQCASAEVHANSIQTNRVKLRVQYVKVRVSALNNQGKFNGNGFLDRKSFRFTKLTMKVFTM